MNRIILLVACVAATASAMSVGESSSKASDLGHSFVSAISDLTSEPGFPNNMQISAIQRKINTGNPEIREAVDSAFVQTAEGKSQLDMKALARAFENVSLKNGLSPTAVLNTIQDDPAYKALMEKLASADLPVAQEQKAQRMPYRRHH